MVERSHAARRDDVEGRRRQHRGELVDVGALERAVALLKEPKQFGGRGALKILGKHPGDGQPVGLYSGRYGPYVKHGKVNATLPDEGMISTVTLEEAVELLAAKAGKGKSKGKTKAAKGGTRAAAKARKT